MTFIKNVILFVILSVSFYGCSCEGWFHSRIKRGSNLQISDANYCNNFHQSNECMRRKGYVIRTYGCTGENSLKFLGALSGGN